MYKSSAAAEMGDRLATIDMGRELGRVVPAFFLGGGGGAGSPSNTMWPGPMPIPVCQVSHFIRPTVWPQYTNITDRTEQTGQRPDSIGRTVLQTVAQK